MRRVPEDGIWLGMIHDRDKALTEKQNQYLAPCLLESQLLPPSEADMQRYFQVTPPTVHQMVVKLDSAGLIEHEPGPPRSIKVPVNLDTLPSLK